MRPGHEIVLSQAYNTELFIDAYNERFDWEGSIGDCDLGAEQLQFYARLLGNMGRDRTETKSRFASLIL